jgi:preprotein translocase subunit Sec63
MSNDCCLSMEDAVLRGWIKKEVFIHDKPQHDIYIAEFVTNKRKSKHWLIYNKEEIQTKEIILKNCLFCGDKL